MSETTASLALIQPLMDEGKHPLTHHLRAYVWLLREIAREVPRASAVWVTIAVLQGLMPPFQLWASGRLVTAIEAEYAGHDAHPWRWVIAMAAVLAGVRLLDPLSTWATSVITDRGMPAIHGRILGHAASVDLELMEYQAFYDVARRIAEQARESLTNLLQSLHELMTNIIPLIGAIIIVAAIDWRLVAVLFLPLLPIVLEAVRQGGAIWESLRSQTHERRIAAYIAGRFSDRQAAREIRIFGLGDELIDRWRGHYLATRKELRGKTTKAQLRLQLSSSVADIFIYAGLIWLITGGFMHATAADITIVIGAFMTVGNQSFSLQQALLAIGTHGGFAEDVRTFTGLPTPFAAQPVAVVDDLRAHTLELENVTFRYPGTERNVIDGVSLNVPPGQTLAIVGENGAGKTTLIKLMLGLYQRDSGSIRVGGRELRDIPLTERYRLLAAVFQTFSRYPESIADNIAMPAQADRADLEQIIADAGLEGVIADAPEGLATILSPDLGGIDLSGGQWQRLAIARAGYRNAAILALDEPTAALDPLAEVDIFRRFAALSEGRTTLLVSHRLGMCRLADRIVVLEHGVMTEDGTHTDLLRNNGHYAELWEMQSRWYR